MDLVAGSIQAQAMHKAPEIKRAVQGGQAQIGEILLVNLGNECRSSPPTACPYWPTAATAR